jgi:hypothetical protein
VPGVHAAAVPVDWPWPTVRAASSACACSPAQTAPPPRNRSSATQGSGMLPCQPGPAAALQCHQRPSGLHSSLRCGCAPGAARLCRSGLGQRQVGSDQLQHGGCQPRFRGVRAAAAGAGTCHAHGHWWWLGVLQELSSPNGQLWFAQTAQHDHHERGQHAAD